jgi:F-type H+-transporting ATPase subunit alpha
MRFAPLALVSTVASVQLIQCQAWSTVRAPQRGVVAFHTSSALSASIAPGEIVSTSAFSQQDQGSPIGEGPIVSYFTGGLAVVQVDDNVTSAKKILENADKIRATKSLKGDDLVGRLARLPGGSLGVVIAERPPMAFVYSDSDIESLDGIVEIMDTMAQIDVGEDMRVVNCFGQPTPSTTVGSHAVFAPIPKVADIALINSPVLTGTTMVDVLAPIGKGQNMLLIGADVDEMRDLACNMFATQSANLKCVYAATRDPKPIMDKLEKAGILDQVTVVAARDGIDGDVAQASEAIVVAGAACSIAEAFAQDNGQDTLVIVDTLDYHKNFWDATTRVLVDIYGIDAVVAADREGGASSEMRGFYSSLIQRAANFKKNGGGTVTLVLMTTIPGAQDDENAVFLPEDFEQAGEKIKARLDILVNKKIPLTAATLRKIQIPIPSVSEGKRRMVLQHVDDLISMSDGQIWLDEEIKQAGQNPPMDPKRSITRVGIGADTESRADAPAIRRIAAGVRLDLAQSASMDGAEVNTASIKQILKRNAWLLAMHQEPSQGGRSLSESCVVLLAASIGSLNETTESGGLAGTVAGQTVIKELLEHVRSRAPSVMNGINESFDITGEARTELEEAIRSYFQ